MKFKRLIALPHTFLLSGAFFLFSLFLLSSLQVAETKTYDVVVVGGGTGGVSAAIQAARQGVRVALVEETDWLGGQMTAAAVSNMDEGGSERSSGIYAEFLQKAVAKYGGEANVHKCYFSTSGMCFEPKIAKDVLNEMVSATGKIDVFYRYRVTAVNKTNTTVTGVVATSTATGATDTFNAKVVIDATEYGDLLPKTGIAYRIGNSVSGNVNQNACIQDMTYTAVIKKYTPIPTHLKITTAPPGYTSTVESRFAEMVTNTNPKAYTDNSGLPFNWSWVKHAGYRGMPDSSRPQNNTNAGDYAGASNITKTGVNFANDYPAERPYFTGNSTLSVRYIEDEAYRKQVNCEAKLKTIQFLYYMQKQGQSWSVADDQGFDTAYNTTENLCSNIPAEFKEIEKRLPLAPYVREARRMIGVTTFTGPQLRAQKKVDRKKGGDVNSVDFSSSIAIGGYDDDLHNCSEAATLESGLESNTDRGLGMGPFQVPLESLIPQSIDGFIAAEKNISQSRLVNGATRLQPITMLTGQAAGSLAALAIQSNRQPRAIKPIEVQTLLLNANSPLTLYSFSDVPKGATFWQSVHLASLYGIMIGNGAGSFGVNETLTRGQTAVILTRLFNIPTDGTENDAITKIRERGISTASSNIAFNASGTLIKGDLAYFLARGLGQNPSSTTTAMSYLSSQNILIGCNDSSCTGQSVSKGQMAESTAGTLRKLHTGVTVIPAEPPTPVSNLKAEVQATKVILTWVPSTGRYMNSNASDGDHIQVYTNPNFTGTKILDGGVGGGTNRWELPVNTSGAYNTVRPGTTYYARVYSYNAPCNCSDGASTSFTTQTSDSQIPAPPPSITGSGVVTSYSPWVVWVTGANLTNPLTVRVYDSNGSFWGNGVGVSYNGTTNISFSLPANNPPSRCNANGACTIFFDVTNSSNQVSSRASLSIPQYTPPPQSIVSPSISDAGVVTTYSPWAVWVTGANLSNLNVRVYDTNGSFWGNGTGIAYNGSTNISFGLPSNTPPSNCNASTSCTISFDVTDTTTNQTSTRKSLSLPRR